MNMHTSIKSASSHAAITAASTGLPQGLGNVAGDVVLEAWAQAQRAFEFAKEQGDDDQRAFFAMLDPADLTLKAVPASSIQGAIAKLRRAFAGLVQERWADEAMSDNRSLEFAQQVRMSDLYEEMLWGAIEDLMRLDSSAARLSPGMAAAIDAWEAAAHRHADYSGPDEEGERLCSDHYRAVRLVASTPALTQEDLNAKVYLLTLEHAYSPIPGEPTFPDEETDYVQDALLREIFHDLPIHSEAVRQIISRNASRFPATVSEAYEQLLAAEADLDRAGAAFETAEAAVDEASLEPALGAGWDRYAILYEMSLEEVAAKLGGVAHREEWATSKAAEIGAWREARRRVEDRLDLAGLKAASDRAYERCWRMLTRLLNTPAETAQAAVTKLEVFRKWGALDFLPPKLEQTIMAELKRLTS